MPGHAAVPRPGAPPRREPERLDRRVRDGRPPLRDVHGPRPLRRQRHGAARAPGPRRGAAQGRDPAAGPAARAALDPRPRRREGPRRAVSGRRGARRRHLEVRGPGPRPRARRGVGHAGQDGQADGHPRGQQVARRDLRLDGDPPDHPEDRDVGDRRRARHDLPAGTRVGRARQPDPRGRGRETDSPEGRPRHRRHGRRDRRRREHDGRLQRSPLQLRRGRLLGLPHAVDPRGAHAHASAARSSASSRS